MPVKKLDASGLVSGVVAWLLDILIGQAAATPIDQLKGSSDHATMPETRPDASNFSLSSAHIS